MVSLNTIMFLTTLSHINLASGNEASSISVQSVYQKVRYRVRDIVGMLQSMQQQVSKDGQEEAEVFSKYQFYCRRGRKALEAAIDDAEETDLEDLSKTIEGEEETRDGIQNTIAEDEAKQADVKAAMEKAKDLRKQEAALFKEESDELRTQIAAMKRAVAVFDRDQVLETSAVPLLKELSGSDIQQQDKVQFKAFLQKVKEGVEDTMPQKERMQILLRAVEILEKRLSHLMSQERSELDDFRDYKAIIKDKTSDLASDIEEKTAEVKELEEKVDVQKSDLEDAARYLLEGRAFLPFISATENCSHREVEWAERCRTRTTELVALSDTITTLTDDAFLDELYEKGLSSPWQEGAHHALLASQQSTKGGQSQKSESEFDILSLALKGKNASFAKFFQVLGGMATMLGKEQSDTHPEKFCGQSINQTEDNLKRLTVTVSDLGTVIARHEERIATLTTEIDEARANIQNLEQHVLESGKVRKKEHEENAEVLTSDNMTMQLFSAARDRLNSFYSQEDPVESEVDGVTLGEIIGPYIKKRDESANIMAMLETTLAELRSEIARVEAKERQDQETWEKSIGESLEKHTRSMKTISEKQGAKADLEATLTNAGKEKTATLQEVKATTRYLSELQGDNTAFLRPVVCSRRNATKPTKIEPSLLTHKNFILW